MLPAPPLKAHKPPELPPHGSGRIAQLVEQLTLNQRVLGSSPSASTIFYRQIKTPLKTRPANEEFDIFRVRCEPLCFDQPAATETGFADQEVRGRARRDAY